MYILGFGRASAKHTITTQTLQSEGISLSAGSPQSRSTIVQNKFFTSAADRLSTSEENSTSLGCIAVQAACQASGIPVDALELMVGDCATPLQTTPSEGQRVAGTLGLKIPAYDIGGGAVANILHLDIVRKWRAGRLPAYSCFFSANAPTHAVDFHTPWSQFFADGASAAICSTVHQGKFKVIDSEVFFSTDELSSLKIEKLGGLSITDSYLTKTVAARSKKLLDAISRKYAAQIPGGFFINNQLTHRETRAEANAAGFADRHVFDFGDTQGDMLGATPFSILAAYQDSFPVGAYIFVIGAGIGSGYGYAVLMVER